MIGSREARAWAACSVFALATFFGAGGALAAPITLDIDSGSNFSLVHQGSNPAGTGGSNNFLRFDPGQSLELELDGMLLSLFGSPQVLTLSSNNGATGIFNVLAFSATLDANSNTGLSGGSLTYDLMSNGNVGVNGDIVGGTFTFADQTYGGPFNSVSLENGTLSLALWGGDTVNDAGIDIVGSGSVPEPGTTALLSLGLAGLLATRRRGRSPTAT